MENRETKRRKEIIAGKREGKGTKENNAWGLEEGTGVGEIRNRGENERVE